MTAAARERHDLCGPERPDRRLFGRRADGCRRRSRRGDARRSGGFAAWALGVRLGFGLGLAARAAASTRLRRSLLRRRLRLVVLVAAVLVAVVLVAAVLVAIVLVEV